MVADLLGLSVTSDVLVQCTKETRNINLTEGLPEKIFFENNSLNDLFLEYPFFTRNARIQIFCTPLRNTHFIFRTPYFRKRLSTDWFFVSSIFVKNKIRHILFAMAGGFSVCETAL